LADLGEKMTAKCDICGKVPNFGHNVSHSHRKTRKRWDPNIQKIKVKQENGVSVKKSVCVSCIRSNRIEKVA
jgi:large subunit ribosomal protein L28